MNRLLYFCSFGKILIGFSFQDFFIPNEDL
jgi:hypothetical protein